MSSSISPETIDRIKKLVAQATLIQSEVIEVMAACRIGGPYPVADGFDADGNPFWYTRSLKQWADEPGRTHVRRDGDESMRYRRGARSSKSFNRETGEFEAIVATETPAAMIDPKTGDPCFEILVADGGEFPERTPLLDNHNRTTALAVVGSMFDFRCEGTQWVGTGQLAEGEDTLGHRIASGAISDVSIGYVVHESHRVARGGQIVINGRAFRNDSDRLLIVSTRWQVKEVSIVPIGADPLAKIRGSEENSMSVAIHSRDSVTGRPGVGAYISGILLTRGMSDPSMCRAAVSSGGCVTPIAPCLETERDADLGYKLKGLRALDILARVAELDGAQITGANDSAACNQLRLFFQSRAFGASNLQSLMLGVFATELQIGWDAVGDSTIGWVGNYVDMARGGGTIKHSDVIRRLEMKAYDLEHPTIKLSGVGNQRANSWWTALLLVCFDSGERISAVMALTWDRVDLRTRWVRFRAEERKGGVEDSPVRLSRDAAAALRKLPHNSAEVFPWPRSKTYLWHQYGRLLKEAGLPSDAKSKFHRIRRTVASYAEAAGGNATAMLRHSKREVTEAYLDPRIVKKQQPADVLFRLKPTK